MLEACDEGACYAELHDDIKQPLAVIEGLQADVVLSSPVKFLGHLCFKKPYQGRVAVNKSRQ